MNAGSSRLYLLTRSLAILLLLAVCLEHASGQPSVPPEGRPEPRTLRTASLATTAAEAVAQAEEPTVLLSFGDPVELRLFVDYVAERTGKNFIYDETLVGTVILRAPEEVPVGALYSILESALELKGWTLVPSPQGFVKVVPAAVAATKPTLFFGPDEAGKLPDEDVIVTQVIEVKYADPTSVLNALQPILSGAAARPAARLLRPTVPGRLARPLAVRRPTAMPSNIIAMPERRLLIVTDYAPNVRHIVKLVQALDREAPSAELDLIPLQFIRAEEYAPKILNYMQARYTQAGLQARVAPLVDYDPRLNTLIVVALAEDLDAVHALIADLDVEAPEAERPYRIIRLKNSNAEEMLETLKEVMAGQEKAPLTGQLTTPAPTLAAPGTPGPAASTSTTTPIGATPIAGTHVTAIAHKHTNSIILVGPPDEQEVLAAIVESLDIRRPQVMIEALIVEVDASKTLDIGVELAHLQPLSGTRVGGATSFGFSAIDFTEGTVGITTAGGLTGFLILDGDVTAIINLLQEKVDGRIVSRPRTLVNDNEPAEFVSQRMEPYAVIGELGADTTTVSFGGYAEAGTTLQITPHISEADYLQLEIYVELSAFQGTGAPPPKTLDYVRSKVTVPDNCTVLLGGLNRTRETITERKVPLLGDIPLLGFLFRRDINVESEITLYVFIKARIARDEDFSDLKALAVEASQMLLKQQNLLRDRDEQLPLDQDVYESPAFRPEIEP